MLFTLEALQAKHGDCLLLHYGDPAAPELIVIDGGPGGVYRSALKPRLRELRQARSGSDPLPIRLLMVSHIDDDHINGVLDLTREMREASDNQEPLPYEIDTLWHNSFDDVVGRGAEELASGATAEVGAASLEGEIPANLSISRPAAALLASVPQGRSLRLDAEALAVEVNAPIGGVLAGPIAEAEAPDLGSGLKFRILGPSRQRLLEFQREWDAELERRKLAADEGFRAESAAYVDKSVYNLASIVVLAELGGKRMLLTGDARGDDILAGVREAGLLGADGTMRVDLLKLPHHGSDRNVETDFFRTILADHYVISGDGRHGNPEAATFEMLLNARGDEPFTLDLTYPVSDFREGYPRAELESLLEEAGRRGRRVRVATPPPGRRSLMVDLLDPSTGI